MRGTFNETARSHGTPSDLWALLVDARTWPEWGTVDELVESRSSGLSADGRDEVGAVRAFRTGRVTTAERIVAIEPDRSFVYADEQNPVMHDYRAEVTLRRRPDGGTDVTWSGTYETSAWVGPFLRPFLRRTMRRMVRGLAAAAAAS